MTRTFAGALGASLVLLGCGSDASTDPPEPGTLVMFDDAAPGDIVGLVADDERRTVSWLHRTDGTVHELDLDDPDAVPVTVARIDVGTDSSQGGLLDQTLLPDGTRALVWTTPAENDLVIGTVDDAALRQGAPPHVEWNAGEAGNGAIGGKITNDGRRIVFSIGRNTAWDADTGIGGAVLSFDLQFTGEPEILSAGFTNPWAVGLVGDDEIWVWDNAAGDDPDDSEREDDERIGRADVVPDRNDMTRSTGADRAPSALIELPDGRIGVCGFLDNELRAYLAVDGPTGPRTELERAGTVMACNTAATVFADGTVVTAAQTPDGESLQILRP